LKLQNPFEREIANLKLNYAVLTEKLDQLDVVIEAIEEIIIYTEPILIHPVHS
jgi:hypothetical protein